MPHSCCATTIMSGQREAPKALEECGTPACPLYKFLSRPKMPGWRRPVLECGDWSPLAQPRSTAKPGGLPPCCTVRGAPSTAARVLRRIPAASRRHAAVSGSTKRRLVAALQNEPAPAPLCPFECCCNGATGRPGRPWFAWCYVPFSADGKSIMAAGRLFRDHLRPGKAAPGRRNAPIGRCRGPLGAKTKRHWAGRRAPAHHGGKAISYLSASRRTKASL